VIGTETFCFVYCLHFVIIRHEYVWPYVYHMGVRYVLKSSFFQEVSDIVEHVSLTADRKKDSFT